MPSQRLILSTVGASLLNSQIDPANKAEKDWFNTNANKAVLSGDDTTKLNNIALQAEAMLATNDVSVIRVKSAELNGVYALNQGRLSQSIQDEHILIATDTAFGRRCAHLVEAFLQKQGLSAYTYVPSKMNTASTTDFEAGCKDLIYWCADTLPRYQGYQVVFNLVGAFKALQGYLNTIGMFYADQILYLFEGKNAAPILIPRLPIQVDLTALTPFAVPLALMAEASALVPLAEVAQLASTLYDNDTHNAMISQWGLLTWQQVRAKLLGETLLSFPRLRCENSFERDFQRTRVETDRVRLQVTLACVSAKLIEHNGNTAVLKGGQGGGVLYDVYAGKQIAGQQIGHFRVSDNLRVSCIAVDGGLTLRHFGSHDYVNNNP